MSINQISVSSWNQGAYSGGGVYDGSTSYISSDLITIDPVIHSIKFTTSPVELDYWHKLQDDSWEIYDTQPYRQGSVSVYLLDENENVLYSGSPSYNVEVNLDNYPTAKYIIIMASEDRGTVNRNIMARDPTPSDTQSTWYTMHSVITYTYESYNWYMTEDDELANDYMPEDVAEYTIPIPFSSWTIIPGVNSGFPVTGAYSQTPALDTIPLPNSQWRITEGYNDGFLFNMLLPNIPYVPPPTPADRVPTVQPTTTKEITDQASIEYRRYMNGYTNPNLYRFRDGELPENTECDVFIKGTHSHRYTSINDYEDFSTECEIP